jgi:tetratricopeptide (TPR) repeat protein
MPDRLERQEQAFRDAPGAVLCHGELVPIDRDGRGYAHAPRYASCAVPFDRQLGWMLARNRVATDTVCARRDLILSSGGFCEDRGVREDYELWLRLAGAGPFVYLDAPLAQYRRHATNLSNDAVYMFQWEAGALNRVPWDVTRDALARAFPDAACRTIAEGEVRLRRGERREAQRSFERALAGAQAGAALFHLAHFAIDDGAPGVASTYLLRALHDEPDNAALWNNLGVALMRQGQASNGRAAFERAVALRPTYDDAARNLEVAVAVAGGPSLEWRVTRRRLRPELMPMAAVA